MSSETDANIVHFCDFTGATPQDARDYLQVSDNNVNLAVTLYLENGGKSLKSSSSTTQDTTTNADTGDDGDSALSDEALARQLHEQESSSRPKVRAPIAPRTDILTGDYGYGGPGTGHFGGLLGRQADMRPSVFNQGDSSSSATTNHQPTDDATAKAKRLADLFRPPFDIMFRGGFEEARVTAKEQSKWLLVNVQDPTEFACQVLNRDLWSDGFVKDIVRESFVFLQYANESSEGKRYLTLYPVRHYPYVAIIDSRTGELAKSWEKQLSPTDFMMEVTEFLEQHSPEAGKSVTMKKPRQTLSDMTEEEQLHAAITASLNPTIETSSSNKAESTTIDRKMESDDDDEKPTSVLDSILPVKRQETSDMANSTRIQFRMADGSRVIRRFLKTDPVRHLFEFIKSQVPETQDQAFELVFNRQQLIDVLDQEIQQAGLQNAAVNVQFA
ncbi:thioredoxin-like protein [Chlamydoabsidia padenii]|nr:thioredoxin-like protein [Chlamydoabsidia padenii]